MTPMLKGAAIGALIGAAALASITQSEARSRWIGVRPGLTAASGASASTPVSSAVMPPPRINEGGC